MKLTPTDAITTLFFGLFMTIQCDRSSAQAFDLAAATQNLAPRTYLKAAIYTGNFLLVTGKDPDGKPTGIAPDLAKALGARLGVNVELIPFATQNEVIEATASSDCDIGLVGADPARAENVIFTTAYVEIEATYMVTNKSPYQNATELDSESVRIGAKDKSAYELWLSRNLKHAKLIKTKTVDEAIALLNKNELDAVAGLRPGLIEDLSKASDGQLLKGRFMAVQQAIATRKANPQAAVFLQQFIEEAKSSGLISRIIKEHQVSGLTIPN